MEGMDRWLEKLAKLEANAESMDELGAELDAELSRQFAAANIPIVSGRLRASLVDRSSPDRVFRRRRGTRGPSFEQISRDPASVFNSGAIPDLDWGPIADIIERHMGEGL